MAIDFIHLDALYARLNREQARLRAATTSRDVAFRASQIASCNREIVDEYKFLGIEAPVTADLSDDELMAELAA